MATSIKDEQEKYLDDMKQNIRATVKAKVDGMADGRMKDKGYIEDDRGSDESSTDDKQQEENDE